ncbi:MAG: glutamate mutase L [Firmicutes bacterium]|nr:glutamate mutase L [Bacillota bacterium]
MTQGEFRQDGQNGAAGGPSLAAAGAPRRSPLAVDALVADIGSTTTVLNAFAGLGTPEPVCLGQGMALTSVDRGDVTLGLQAALEDLQARLGRPVRWERFLATSSAAGGLRLTVHGLVPEMTLRAAREAALGAGGIVRQVTAGKMSSADLQELSRVQPRLIILAGGVDYGERETILFNARALAEFLPQAGLAAVPVLYAGNVAARAEAVQILASAGLQVRTTDNVYPRVDVLQVEPARRAIQELFEEHIVSGPGMEKVRRMIDGPILPTPGAVMLAAEILYQEIGDLVVLDVGGATTDVHSVTAGSPELAGRTMYPEPLAKRTVEGDLGVFANAGHLLELFCRRLRQERRWPDWDLGGTLEAELREIPQSAIPGNAPGSRPGFAPGPGSAGPAPAGCGKLARFVAAVPETAEQAGLSALLTWEACRVALERHAGFRRQLFSGTGGGTGQEIVEGRDLTAVRWVVGTGGALTRLPRHREILPAVLAAQSTQRSRFRPTAGGLQEPLLPPADAEVLLDEAYIMAACGVLSRLDAESARRLLVRYVVRRDG